MKALNLLARLVIVPVVVTLYAVGYCYAWVMGDLRKHQQPNMRVQDWRIV